MSQSRYYSATAIPTTLVGSVTPSTTTIVVSATTGFPASTPFILALDYGTPSEEVVLVTAVAGTSLTVTRAYDGTSGTSHNTGAPVRHTWTAMDGNDSRAHEAATSGVHGISALSNVVGTTDTQSLTNKTLVAPTITGTVNLASPNITGTVTGGASYTAPTIAGGTISGNIAGNPTFTAGAAMGSTGQTTFDTSGKPKSTSFVTSYATNTTTSSSMTNTTYAAVTPTLTATAIVPPSGKLKIEGLVRADSNASHFTFSSFNVTGSVSGVIQAPSDTLSANIGSGTYTLSSGYVATVVTSANIGETVTVEWQHHTDSAGGIFVVYNRNIIITPLIG